jgi:UDP-3-O-[3-hydroxymyristoyl] glucosamine N-acyltransferase
MKLSELCAQTEMELLRDAEFDALGLTYCNLPKMLTVLYDERYLRECSRNAAVSCVITSPPLARRLPAGLGVALSADPQSSFLKAHLRLLTQTEFYGAAFPSEIAASARIHATAFVAEKNVRIGAKASLGAGSIVLEGASIGEGSIIGPGSVIGAEGFSPAPEGSPVSNVPHSGACRIGAMVDVGANVVICRGSLSGSTIVEDHVVVSSLVNISHNVVVGRRSRIGAAACILGSAQLGEGVWIGPNATVSNRVQVGAFARVSIGSVVARDVAAGQVVTGNFAMEHRKFLSWFRRAHSATRTD